MSHERHGLSNHHKCLLNGLLMLTPKNISSSVSLAICARNPVDSGNPSQIADKVESVSMSWHRHNNSGLDKIWLGSRHGTSHWKHHWNQWWLAFNWGMIQGLFNSLLPFCMINITSSWTNLMDTQASGLSLIHGWYIVFFFNLYQSWWCFYMETLSALLAL